MFQFKFIFFLFYTPTFVSKKINQHLDKIQSWLNLWRLKMAPHKCNYLVFTNSNRDDSNELNLILNGTKLTTDNSPTFLGIRFDHHLTFNNQIEYLKKTCMDRLNIIKILAYKTWQLTKQTLIQIYNVLIRSIIEYSAIIAPIISAANLNTLQIIQNNALRLILNKPKITRTRIEYLHEEANIDMIDTRLTTLRKRYVLKAIHNNNPIIKDTISEYLNFSGGRYLNHKTLLCDMREQIALI
jgi:hypothetical protein